MQITWIFIFINLGIFILQTMGLFGGLSFTPALFIKEPWTILTSMFMHGSLQHLLFNMFGLFMFGTIVEHELGKKKWLILYLFAGLIGSLAYMSFGRSPFISALGASGAIFGLIGAAAMLKPKMIIWTSFGPFPMIVAAIGWGLTQFIGIFGVDTIAQSAHIGGLIGGIIITILLIKNIKKPIMVALLILPIIAAFIIGAYIPSEVPNYTEHPENFTLNYSDAEFNAKIFVYEKEDEWFFSIISPAYSNFNLAAYSKSLEETTKKLYADTFGNYCPNETIEYVIDVNHETASIKGTVCNQKFKAISAICPKNVDVKLIEFYKNEPYLENVVSCTGLSS